MLSAATKASNNRAAQALAHGGTGVAQKPVGAAARITGDCVPAWIGPRPSRPRAHKLARLIYFMLTKGQGYVEAGQDGLRAEVP